MPLGWCVSGAAFLSTRHARVFGRQPGVLGLVRALMLGADGRSRCPSFGGGIEQKSGRGFTSWVLR